MTNCRINLPDNVKIRNVAKVMAVAAGLERKWEGRGGGRWVECSGFEVTAHGVAGLATIELQGTMVGGETTHCCTYHFESDDGGRLLCPRLCPRSAAFWIAMGHKLVDFFGGWLDYSDCDEDSISYQLPPKADCLNRPEEDEDWLNFQHRLYNLQPITQQDLDFFSRGL
jgi:hypothetical protein